MIEKYWFILNQSHYPPPHLPKSGFGIGNRAICWGHIILDLTIPDGVINWSEEGIEFTPSVEAYTQNPGTWTGNETRAWSLDWLQV